MKANRVAALGAVLCAALTVAACRGPQRPRVVRIESGEALGSVFPAYGSYTTEPIVGESQGLLLHDDDLVLGDSAIARYFLSDGPVLRLASSAWCTRLAGRTIAVSLKADSARWWLEKAPRSDLGRLRMVSAPDSLDGASLRALQRLASANPTVGFAVESRAALLQILTLFRPHTLFLTDESGKLPRDVAGLRELETLILPASESGSLDGLPALARLRRLAICGWDVGAAGPLPAGMSGLKSLAVLGGRGLQDTLALRSAPAGLVELSIVTQDDPVDLAPLANLPELTTLVLDRSEISGDPAGFASLRKLERVGLPANTTQAQFAAVIAAHPDLRTVELVPADSVTDLAPLRGLKRLQGLVLSGRDRNLDVLRELHSLRYVGLECDTSRASRERLATLRKALPDALVVPIRPFCLGSGWILLLVPAVAGFWLLAARTRRPRPGGVRAG